MVAGRSGTIMVTSQEQGVRNAGLKPTFVNKDVYIQLLKRNNRIGSAFFEQAKKNLSPVKRRGRLLE